MKQKLTESRLRSLIREEIGKEQNRSRFSKEDLSNQLVKAAQWGTEERIKKLISLGADPNYLSGTDENNRFYTHSFYQGASPVMIAVKENKIKNLKALIHAGGDVNLKRFGKGDTPLAFAIDPSGANLKMIRMLLTAGADPKIKFFPWYSHNEKFDNAEIDCIEFAKANYKYHKPKTILQAIELFKKV